MRTAKELLIASKDFASENRWLSWWHLWSTLGVLAGLVAAAVNDLPWGIRVASSVAAGLVGVRLFIIYHDHQHGAILRDSWIAAFLMRIYGVLMLNPASVWNRSHDHHHKHNSKTFGASIGSFPIMTTHAYASASSTERFGYAAARHPLTMVFGYVTVFLWGMCLRPFLQSPRRHFDGGLAILANLAVMTYLGTVGLDVLLLGLVFPSSIAAALGAYLFYAQHNYPDAKLNPRSQWSHVDAALHSSCFIMMNPVMNWFTGNIGYHHVHHLNARIPFYRLPEAMAALEELQSPGTTSLNPRDIAACLRLKLWSPEEERFVGFNGI
jgi:omega-6 fatty acid desaturase (delta-12 desaturase)